MDKLDRLKSTDRLRHMCEEFCNNSVIDSALYSKFGVKRGLRNSDGSGVVAGISLSRASLYIAVITLPI